MLHKATRQSRTLHHLEANLDLPVALIESWGFDEPRTLLAISLFLPDKIQNVRLSIEVHSKNYQYH